MMSARKLSPQQLGGLAVAQKYAPTAPCFRCGKTYPFLTPWHSYQLNSHNGGGFIGYISQGEPLAPYQDTY
jgi:hypothetical protein